MRQVGSFSEFLKTGALGPVRPGAVRSLVLQEFGEPEVFSNGWAVLTPQQPMHESSSWGYGFLQVGFKSDVVVDLGFYYAFEGKGLTIPKHLAITGLPRHSLTLREFENSLEEIGLLVSAKVDRWNDEECQYTLSSGVYVLLTSDRVLSVVTSLKGPLVLRSIQDWYSERRR
ncbi:MAG TPA: hypothetical protein VH619_03295 [Verrucomicrobiae bacterium]|jgi:hypothetical protein|nr:hypothetical protein [Verrucomicrobiae bacterium]